LPSIEVATKLDRTRSALGPCHNGLTYPGGGPNPPACHRPRVKLRDDPSFTWEQADDLTAAEVFVLDAGREPDP
jgi:hypothetical protein